MTDELEAARADLGKIPPEEWVRRHADSLLRLAALGANIRDTAGASLELVVAARDVMLGLRAALNAFTAASGWPRQGLKPTAHRWQAAQVLASRAQRCVLSFLQAARDTLGTAGTAPAGVRTDAAVRALEEVVAEEEARRPELEGRLEDALGKLRALVQAHRRGGPPGDPTVN